MLIPTNSHKQFFFIKFTIILIFLFFYSISEVKIVTKCADKYLFYSSSIESRE